MLKANKSARRGERVLEGDVIGHQPELDQSSEANDHRYMELPSGRGVKMLAVHTTLLRPSWPAYHALQCPRHVFI